MKTPEEIKRGMEHCKRISNSCRNCTYWVDCMATLDGRPLLKDALAYIQRLESDNASKDERIQMLEAGMEQWHDVAASPGAVEDMARENYRLTQELATIKRERDAAKNDLYSCQPCFACSHFRHNGGACRGANECFEKMGECAVEGIEYVGISFVWRGVCPENTEAD